MADYNINAVTRRVVYSGSAGLGPYSFSFEVLDQDDLAVYFNTTKLTLTTDYTVTINANGTGSITIVTGTNVPSTPTGSDTIIIVGARDIERVTDFVTAGDLRASALNEQLDGLTIFDQQIAEEQKRTLQAPVYDPAHVDDGGTLDMTLPAKSARAGKYLQFNSTTGNPEAGPDSTDVTNLADVATDIALLADIQDGTTATNAITTVSGISANVTTVAGIASNVSTVAGISADVTSVAADATDIGTVATNIASVNTVAGNISEVVAVANDLNEAVSEVETVANDLNEAVSEIETVAASISNVDTVGTNIANVNTVAGIDSNVTTVAGISANVTTVAGISSNVTTVAGISSDVTTVAADGTDIGTVAGAISNVNTVAGISGDVTTVAGVSANVTTVATDITNVNTVASNIADVNNFALTYRIAASAPTTSLDEGDLYFDTTQNQMFVYDGSAWVAVAPDLVGDTSPQLGGNLDLNGNDITGTGDIDITGTITSDGLTVGETLSMSHTGNTSTLSFTQKVGTQNSEATIRANREDASTSAARLIFSTNDGTSTKDRIRIAGNGDVSLYADDGTTQGFFWDASTQELGLGTTSPAFSSGSGLEISKSDTATLRVERTGATASAGEFFAGNDKVVLASTTNTHLEFRTNGTERLRITSDGNLQAGATSGRGGSGTGHLFKMPSGDIYFEIMGNAAGSNTDILFSDGTGGSYGVVGYDHTNDALRFFANSGERVRIDSSGRVLTYKTSAGLANPGIEHNFTANNGYLAVTSTGTTAYFNREDSDGTILEFRKDNSGVGVIGTQNWGIGTAAPSDILHIKNSASTNVLIDAPTDNATLTLQCGSSDAGAEGAFVNFIQNTTYKWQMGMNTDNSFRWYNYNTSSEAMQIDTNGNLLLGKSSGVSDSYLQIAGSSSESSIRLENSYASGTAILINNQSNASFNALYFENGGTNRGSIVVGTSSTAYNTSSDYRLKENVTADWDATTRLKQLNPVRFNFISDADTTVDGFLAHEVQDIVPEAITGTHNEVDADGNPVYQGIDQSKLVPLLVKTIQELEARIAALEAN